MTICNAPYIAKPYQWCCTDNWSKTKCQYVMMLEVTLIRTQMRRWSDNNQILNMRVFYAFWNVQMSVLCIDVCYVFQGDRPQTANALYTYVGKTYLSVKYDLYKGAWLCKALYTPWCRVWNGCTDQVVASGVHHPGHLNYVDHTFNSDGWLEHRCATQIAGGDAVWR